MFAVELFLSVEPIWHVCPHKGRRSSHGRKHQIYGVVYSRRRLIHFTGCKVDAIILVTDFQTEEFWPLQRKTIKYCRTAIKWTTKAMLFVNRNPFTRFIVMFLWVKDHFRLKKNAALLGAYVLIFILIHLLWGLFIKTKPQKLNEKTF